jgi:hypothetical protein
MTDREILLCSRGFPLRFKKFEDKSRKAVRRQRYWSKTIEGRDRRLRPFKDDRIDEFKQVTFRLRKEEYLKKREEAKQAWKRLLLPPPITLPAPIKKDSLVVKPKESPKKYKVPREIKIVPYQGPADFVGTILKKKWAI